MLHLLHLEWKKLKYYRLFTVLIGLYLIGMPAMYVAIQNMPGFGEALPNGAKSFFSFPYIWKYLGYQGSWMTFFCFGFLGVMLVTMEVSNKTMRQNVITGMSRERFFLGKVYAMLAISLFATLYYVLLVMVFGYMNTDYIMPSRITDHLDFIPRYWLMTFSYMSFAFLLGMLIRRGGIALFAYFSYVIIGEPILRYGVHQKIFGVSDYMNYYPLNAIEDVVPMPFPDNMLKGPMEQAQESGLTFFLSISDAVIFSSIYTFIFLGLAYWIFKKRDL